jgi:hypothetical protein
VVLQAEALSAVEEALRAGGEAFEVPQISKDTSSSARPSKRHRALEI